MISGAFSTSEKAYLPVVEVSQNSAKYISVSEKSVTSFWNDIHNNNATFQQVNAAIHISTQTIG